MHMNSAGQITKGIWENDEFIEKGYFTESEAANYFNNIYEEKVLPMKCEKTSIKTFFDRVKTKYDDGWFYTGQWLDGNMQGFGIIENI